MANESKQEKGGHMEMKKIIEKIISCPVGERDKLITRGLALSPLEGKRAKIGEEFSPYFSDYAWIRNMVKVTTEWLECYILTVEDEATIGLYDDESERLLDEFEHISEYFDSSEYVDVKEKEKVTKSPVKAVSEYVAQKLGEKGLSRFKPYVQIGCTEEQIEFASYSLMIKDVLDVLWKPAKEELLKTMADLEGRSKSLDMFAKELEEGTMYVFKQEPYMTSGFGALVSKNFPEIDWEEYVEREFAESYLGLTYNPYRGQAGYMGELLYSTKLFNAKVHEMDSELYLYRGQEYYIANWILQGIVDGLPDEVDLSPTSLLWNVGEAFAYSREMVKNTTQGLKEAYK